MTSEPLTTTANKVIVVGMLDTMLVRDRSARRGEGRGALTEVTTRELRMRGKGGTRQELAIQTRAPYGGMFAMKIELEPDVPGAELLDQAQADTLLAFEGMLQLKQTFNPTFARDQQDHRGRLDRGLPTRMLQMYVARVREPNEQESRTGSAVWLEGEVAEPPQVKRHPELPSIQLAGTILKVTYARPAGLPGLSAALDETVEINVAIPTSSTCAGALYRQGNVVRVVGQLDCQMERQAGQSVTARLAEIDSAWVASKAELANKPQELRRAERAYRAQRMRIEEAPRLYVLALNAELLSGEPMELGDTFQMRRDWTRAQRQQREERRARIAADRQRRAGNSKSRHSDDMRINDASILPIGDVGIHAEAGVSEAVRPRRKVEETGEQFGGASSMDNAVSIANDS
jgi:hypothetical protein